MSSLLFILGFNAIWLVVWWHSHCLFTIDAQPCKKVLNSNIWTDLTDCPLHIKVKEYFIITEYLGSLGSLPHLSCLLSLASLHKCCSPLWKWTVHVYGSALKIKWITCLIWKTYYLNFSSVTACVHEARRGPSGFSRPFPRLHHRTSRRLADWWSFITTWSASCWSNNEPLKFNSHH